MLGWDGGRGIVPSLSSLLLTPLYLVVDISCGVWLQDVCALGLQDVFAPDRMWGTVHIGASICKCSPKLHCE